MMLIMLYVFMHMSHAPPLSTNHPPAGLPRACESLVTLLIRPFRIDLLATQRIDKFGVLVRKLLRH